MGAVAIWTSADQPGLGDQLLGRVIQQELLARLPGWRMTLCSPDGWRRPAVADGGLVTEPLRDRSPAELTEGATLTVVCSDDPFTLDLAARLDADHPLVLFGVRDVPDELAERAAFVAEADPALLLDRVVDAASLPVRVTQLRRLGELGDEDYDVTELPDDLVFEDRLAILSAANSVTTDDPHTAAACAWLGVRCEGPAPRGTVVELRAELDRVADLAEKALAEQGDDLPTRVTLLAQENHALRQSHWQLRQRMFVERQRLVEPYAELLKQRDEAVAEAARLRTANDELTTRNEQLAARLAHVESELSAWQSTKLVRWTRPLRDAYGKARG
ncbi:hypothetical protein JCM33774_39970 [Actinophytocola sp. KF-1]